MPEQPKLLPDIEKGSAAHAILAIVAALLDTGRSPKEVREGLAIAVRALSHPLPSPGGRGSLADDGEAV